MKTSVEHADHNRKRKNTQPVEPLPGKRRQYGNAGYCQSLEHRKRSCWRAIGFSRRYHIEGLPVAVSMTYNYRHMPQCRRVTVSKRPPDRLPVDNETSSDTMRGGRQSLWLGVRSASLIMADPERDMLGAYRRTPYLASVMFDAQLYSQERNIELTRVLCAAIWRTVGGGRHSGAAQVEGSAERPAWPATWPARRSIMYKKPAWICSSPTWGTEQQTATLKNCRFRGDVADALRRRWAGSC